MKRGWDILAIALSIAAAVAVAWVPASNPGSALLCNFVHPDCLSNHWLMVWVAEQLAAGTSILHNDRYYWPIGDAPWLAGNGSEGIAYLPFHLAFGWPAGSNAWLGLVLVLNGISTYLLARSAGASPPASLAAAPTGATLVFAIHELGAGRFSQVSFFWLAFFLAAWLRVLRRPSLGGAVLAAVLLAATSLFYWYFGFFGVLAGAGLLLAFVGRGAGPPLRVLAVFAGTYLALITPLLAVFLEYWASIPGTGEDTFPHPEAVQDSTWPGIPFLVAGGRHAGRALPFSTCALALLALGSAVRGRATPPERRRLTFALAGVALLFAGLMAGARLPHGPYEWIYGIAGPLRRFWWPYRHVVGLNLALIALAALGAERLLQAFPRVGRPAAVLLALSIPAQLTLQASPWQAQFSLLDRSDDFYPSLRKLPGDVLIEPPLAPEVASAQTPLIYQIFHGKALLAGHALWVERVRPDPWDSHVSANSFLAEMQRLDRGELGTVFRFEPTDLARLRDSGARTFVVNWEYFPVAAKGLPAAYEALFTALFGDPVATGTRLKAWDAGTWNGVAAVEIPRFEWPSSLRFGGPTLPLQAPRPPSVMFSVPAPPRPPPTKGDGARRPR
jgi:hypothetical protein